MTRSRRLTLLAGLALAASAATCNWCPTIAAVVDLPLAVKTHLSTSLSASEAKAITDTATTILQAGNSSADVACQVAFTIQSLGSFATGAGVVNSQFDFDALFSDAPSTNQTSLADVPASLQVRQVRVVSEIRWCGAIAANFAGCSDQPGQRIAVVRRGPDREGVLWAHEIGHSKGLAHRNNWAAVMFATILPGHAELTAGECTAFRN